MTELRETKSLQGKPVLILGLGLFGGGLGAARFCAQQGAKVTVSDLKSEQELAPSLAKLEDLPIRYKLGTHDGLSLGKYAMVVVNPAVPKDAPVIQQAEAEGAYLTSEMNLFMARCPGKVVGVTGSNGKSTTTALIAHLLQGSDRRVWLGGNIGVSLLEQVHEIGERDAVVLELSSFMLEDLHRIRISPTVAVLLNVTPNHLDRHGTVDSYAWAKSAIFRYQRPNDITILNFDDARASLMQSEVPSRLALYSLKKRIQPGGWVERGEFRIDLGREVRRVCSVAACPLPGDVNRSNALAAILAAAVMRTPIAEIGNLLPRFAGIEHRLEPCGERDDISFYNDSVSTTPESTIASAMAFPDQEIWLICGGADKQLDYYELAEGLTESQVAGIIGIGEIGPRIIEECQRMPGLESAALLVVPDLAEAMNELRVLAQPGQVVLFSPATSSYDQYANFEQRGRHFKDLLETWQRDAAAASIAGAGAADPFADNPFGDNPFVDGPLSDNPFGDDAFGGTVAGDAPFIQDPLFDEQPEGGASQEEYDAMPPAAPDDYAVETPNFGESEPTGWSDTAAPYPDAVGDFADDLPFEEAYGGTAFEKGGAQMSDAGLESLPRSAPPGEGSTEGIPTDWAAASFPEASDGAANAWPATTAADGSWAEPDQASPWTSDDTSAPASGSMAVPDFGEWDDDSGDPWEGDQWVDTEAGGKPGSKPGSGPSAPASNDDDDDEAEQGNNYVGDIFGDSLNLIEPMETSKMPRDELFGGSAGPTTRKKFFAADEDSDVG